MNSFIWSLVRILHILAGVLWVGAAVFYLFFISPTVKAIGSSGGQFMGHLVGKSNYPSYMGITSVLTVLSGAVLFTFTSGYFNPNWITSSTGLVFTISSAAAIVAFFIGFGLIKPWAGKVGDLTKKIAASQGSPDSGLLNTLHAAEAELLTIERVELVFMAIALIGMAVARYAHF